MAEGVKKINPETDPEVFDIYSDLENRKRKSPPPLQPDEQLNAQTEMDTDKFRNSENQFRFPSSDPSDDNLRKGDIESDITSISSGQKKPETEADDNEAEENYDEQYDQMDIAAKESAQKQMRRAAKTINQQGQNKLSINFSGPEFQIIKKIPGIGIMFRQFEGADLKSKIKILQRIRRIIGLTKVVFAEIEGLAFWGELFVASLPTIIIPILLLLSLPVWFLFLAVFPEKGPSPTAKAIDQATKKINRMIKTVQEALQKEEERTQMLNNLKQMELNAANEPMADSARKAA